MLVLIFVALWFILRGDLLYVFPCVILFLCFLVLLLLRLPRLGEEGWGWVGGRANLGAFREFVRFVLVWICRFPLPLGIWEGLRFVIVALPGLFSYLSFSKLKIYFLKKVLVLSPKPIYHQHQSRGKCFLYTHKKGGKVWLKHYFFFRNATLLDLFMITSSWIPKYSFLRQVKVLIIQYVLIDPLHWKV